MSAKRDILPLVAERPDAWEEARAGRADAFAVHRELAARDPVRVLSDLLERPRQLYGKALARFARSPTDPEAIDEVGDAKERMRSLEEQVELMRRRVHGVDDDAVAEAAAELSAAAAARFREQARRCQTRPQLAALRALHDAPGGPLTWELVADLAERLPEDQREAFTQDAAICFTPAQVERLAAAYASGKRAWDPVSDRGEWLVEGEETVLGY